MTSRSVWASVNLGGVRPSSRLDGVDEVAGESVGGAEDDVGACTDDGRAQVEAQEAPKMGARSFLGTGGEGAEE